MLLPGADWESLFSCCGWFYQAPIKSLSVMRVTIWHWIFVSERYQIWYDIICCYTENSFCKNFISSTGEGSRCWKLVWKLNKCWFTNCIDTEKACQCGNGLKIETASAAICSCSWHFFLTVDERTFCLTFKCIGFLHIHIHSFSHYIHIQLSHPFSQFWPVFLQY